MEIHRQAKIIVRSLRRFGSSLADTLEREGVKGVFRQLAERAARKPGARSAFDLDHGVDTDGVVAAHRLDIASANYIYGNRYQGCDPEFLRGLIESLRLPPHRYVFIDLGSGKGRALLVAAEFPFKQIIGVEYAADLHEVAVRNMKSCRTATRQCPDIELRCMDAAEFQFPEDPLVIFLYNPFEPNLLLRVLKNVEESRARQPRDIVILYVNIHPGAEHEFSKCPGLRKVSLGAEPYHYAIYRSAMAVPPEAQPA